MNLLDSSRRIGALRAVELACFRRLGERAPWLAPASCAGWAASASRAHAWRASLLEELLPVSVGLPGPEELTVLPVGALGDELARALPDRGHAGPDPGPGAQSGDLPQDDGLLLVADVSGRLYPCLLGEYARLLDLCAPAADGPLVRTVGRAVADLEVVRAQGAKLLHLAH